mmetsp:Transcript_115442/g.337619  ORF Transcript_115442/g.337619 Transcript_115442/m.337619 type:complete len:393 (+) Transcript_115442:65-1243(+)
MAAHGAKRTRWEEEGEVAPEDLDSVLDQELWPLLRERCASVLRGRLEAEVRRAREALEAEFQGRWAALQAREAAAEGALQAAEETRAQAEAEREALEREKQRMAASTSMDDVLQLNVGGEKTVAVQRRTLCVVEDSMLASSFSGRWDDSLLRDEHGAVFVDFGPELFMPLLDFLRARRVQEDTATPVLMPAVLGHEERFHTMLKYYGLEHVGQSPPAPLSFLFVPSVEGRTFELLDGGRTAVRSTGSHWKRIFGSALVQRPSMAAPLTATFCIGASPADGLCEARPSGPNLGFAAAALERASDASNERKKEGVWAYRAVDGALLAPRDADIVGPSAREPAVAGDVVTLTIFRDGTVGLAKNKEDLGIVFCNLPETVKPVVEMNLRSTRVSIL